MHMPPLLRSNARSLATDVTDRRDRRVDESSSTACLLLSYEHQTHPDPGGFSVPREHIGRLPSASLPLLPPNRWARLTSRSGAPEVEQRRRSGRESRARKREALEFLSRRRRTLKNSNPRGFRETSIQESDANFLESRHLGKSKSWLESPGMRTPAATPNRQFPYIVGCIFACIFSCIVT